MWAQVAHRPSKQVFLLCKAHSCFVQHFVSPMQVKQTVKNSTSCWSSPQYYPTYTGFRICGAYQMKTNYEITNCTCELTQIDYILTFKFLLWSSFSCISLRHRAKLRGYGSISTKFSPQNYQIWCSLHLCPHDTCLAPPAPLSSFWQSSGEAGRANNQAQYAMQHTSVRRNLWIRTVYKLRSSL